MDIYSLLTKLFGNKANELARSIRQHYRIAGWRRRQLMRGCKIDNSVQFLGHRNGHESLRIAEGLHLEPQVTIWISSDDGANPILEFDENIYVGRHTYIGVYLPIKIGAHTIIGAYSYIISANHRSTRRDVPIRSQGFTGAPIIIGEDVWIGTHVVILPGVTVGRGAIIAAGSVVNRSVPDYQIWGGVPARFLKERP